MNYKEMVKAAKASGKVTEKQMWESVESVSNLMDCVKDAHPDMYWAFMREQVGIMNGGHYDEQFAMYDVSMIEYTDKDGKAHKGAYWTCEQTEEATRGMTFPSSTTKWDVFVGLNSFYADTCKALTSEQIIKAAYQYFFADEDWDKTRGSKIWCYMNMVHSK